MPSRKSGFGERIAGGALFGRLKHRAFEYLRDPHKLQDLTRRGLSKANAVGARGVLAEVWESLRLLLRLLRAYAKGDYRQVPAKSLILIVAGVLYFLLPIDVIPDFLIGFGYIDDAAVLAWVVGSVRTVLREFEAWDQARPADQHDLTTRETP